MVIFLMLLKRLKSVKVSPSVLSSPGFCFVCFLFLLKHLIYRLTTWWSQLIRSFCELEVCDFRLLSRFVQFFTLCAIGKDFLLFFIFSTSRFSFFNHVNKNSSLFTSSSEWLQYSELPLQGRKVNELTPCGAFVFTWIWNALTSAVPQSLPRDCLTDVCFKSF